MASESPAKANLKLFYVICDGFPDPQSGFRVVEAEDENGVVSETITGAKW